MCVWCGGVVLLGKGGVDGGDGVDCVVCVLLSLNLCLLVFFLLI